MAPPTQPRNAFTLRSPIHCHCTRFLHATPTPPSVRMYVYLLFTIPPHPRHPTPHCHHLHHPPRYVFVPACFTLRLYALQAPHVLRSAFSFHSMMISSSFHISDFSRRSRRSTFDVLKNLLPPCTCHFAIIYSTYIQHPQHTTTPPYM